MARIARFLAEVTSKIGMGVLPMDFRAQDRRRFPRYTALSRAARVGWWSGPRFRSTRARLVNISPSGTLIEVNEVPPGQETVWVSFGEGSGIDSGWCESLVVAQAPARALLGGHRLRLEFVEETSRELFEAATRAEEPYPTDRSNGSKLLTVPAPIARLGLSWPTSPESVQHAYRQLAKSLHPDHGGSTTAFLELRSDYEAALALARQWAAADSASQSQTAPFSV